MKHVMVKHEFFSNCDVVLTWPYDKVKELTLPLLNLFTAYDLKSYLKIVNSILNNYRKKTH